MSVTKEASGRYLARVSFLDRSTGRRVYKKKRFDRKRDAEDWVLTQKADEVRGVRFEPSRERFGDILDQWAARLSFSTRADATIYTYRSAARLRFGAIRRIPLAELTPAMCGRLIDHWRAEGLKESTIGQARMVLRMVLDEAVADRLIQRNPLSEVRKPLKIESKASTWSAADVRRFLEVTADDEAHDLFVLLFATLARIGELCALRWEDIEGDRLHIRRTWTKDATGRRYVGAGTKTASATRTVPLVPEVAALLRRMRMGRTFDDGGWVCWLGGTVARPDRVREHWRRAVSRSGLPELTPHGARHAGATAMIAAGVSPAIVQRLLGHKTPAFSLALYVQLSTEDTVPGVASLGALYGLSAGAGAQTVPNVVDLGEKRRRSGGF